MTSTSHLQADEDAVHLFKTLPFKMQVRNDSCHKCGIQFEQEDRIKIVGHISRRKYYHEKCFSRY